MANPYYTHGTFPVTGASGSSSAMRSELDAISAGFDLLPTLAANAGKFALVNSGATALTVSSAISESGGNISISGGLAVTGAVSGAGFSTLLASPPAIGGTAAAAGSFTTLSASSTVSGTGFSNYLAAPPAIGGTTPAAGSFTTLTASSTVTVNGGTVNQVQYLNASKVLSGSANLTFDGTTLTSTGLAGPLNGTVGATTPNTGSFTTLAVSSTFTLSAGTANMVPYLNASKQITGSGNFTFSGFWLGIGGGTAGTQTAGVSAYSSVAVAYRLVNSSSGTATTDGVDIELNGLDLNIINREAGNLTLQTNATTALSINSSQVVTLTNSPAITGGTANGIGYLNGSKVLTTGTALVFDGTNMGVGVAVPTQKLQVAGTIHSTTGGFKFPDGTTQTTAGGGAAGAAPDFMTLSYGII